MPRRVARVDAAGRRRVTNTQIPAGAAGRPHRRAGAEAVAEVGVRISRRHVRLVAADGRRRPSVRRQPERHGLRARREERLHPLDVHARRAACARRCRSGRAKRRDAYAVYFGDTGANVYALDAATGRELWSRRLDEHLYARITGSPTLYQDRLYVPVSSMEETAASQQGYECCTFRGSLNALDVKTGATVWRTLMVPPAAGGREERRGRRAVGTVGRRHLVGADDRRRSAASSTPAPATPTARRRSRPPTRSSRFDLRAAPSSGSSS